MAGSKLPIKPIKIYTQTSNQQASQPLQFNSTMLPDTRSQIMAAQPKLDNFKNALIQKRNIINAIEPQSMADEGYQGIGMQPNPDTSDEDLQRMDQISDPMRSKYGNMQDTDSSGLPDYREPFPPPDFVRGKEEEWSNFFDINKRHLGSIDKYLDEDFSNLDNENDIAKYLDDAKKEIGPDAVKVISDKYDQWMKNGGSFDEEQ